MWPIQHLCLLSTKCMQITWHDYFDFITNLNAFVTQVTVMTLSLRLLDRDEHSLCYRHMSQLHMTVIDTELCYHFVGRAASHCHTLTNRSPPSGAGLSNATSCMRLMPTEVWSRAHGQALQSDLLGSGQVRGDININTLCIHIRSVSPSLCEITPYLPITYLLTHGAESFLRS